MAEVFDRYTDTAGNYHWTDVDTGHHIIRHKKIDVNLQIINIVEHVPHFEFEDVPAACRHCPNHPSNGGTGVCGCILGQAVMF